LIFALQIVEYPSCLLFRKHNKIVDFNLLMILMKLLSLYSNLPMLVNTLISTLSTLSRGLPTKGEKILCTLIFLFVLTIHSVVGQIAGPCNTTLTITNASNPTAADGVITVTGLVGSSYYMYLGITGSEMYADMENTTATSKIVLTGLVPGTYTIRVIRNNSSGAWQCGWVTQTVTVGATPYATCAATEIGGLVFHDANANGVREAGEPGAVNVTVKAYNAAGTLVNTQISAASGVFKLTGLASGVPYRLEYSWADSYLQSGAIGTGSGTSVQFVNSGTCAANFGVNFPANYCQTANPYIITPCYINGNPQAPAVAPLDVMVTYPYKLANHDLGVGGQNAPPTHVATATQMGATWGVAYQKTTKYVFAGAVMRRFAGFGPLGTGGIYKINMATPTAPTVGNWIDVKTIGINTGNDTRNATAANTLSTAPGTPAWDAEAFNKVGKIGIGGMDFNDRGDTMWLMNLSDRKLYGIKNVNPSVAPVAADVIGGYAVTLPAGYTCATNAGDLRPWAVKYYNGLVYIGAVCSGETTPWTPANMRGYVLSFNPANPAAGFTHVHNFALNYTKYAYGTGGNSNFYNWVSNTTAQDHVTQPMLTDLEFDVDGALIIAVGDRGGFQSGNQNYYADPTATNTTLLEGNTYGDVLRFCKTGATYTQSGPVGCPDPSVKPFTYAEYYWGDHGPATGSTNYFNELGAGSLVFSAANNSILMGSQDSYGWYSGGTIALSNKSGGDLYRYVIYDASTPGGAGKATGLGDLEALCDPAPIEIGNRVWLDTDRDGIQDAGEAGLSGIVLQLYQGATLIGSATTDANGNYKFIGVLPNTTYQIRIALGQVPLGGKPLTTSDAGANDLIDSDMTKSGTTGIINLTTGYYGENNHTYDIGFEPDCNTSVTVTGSDNCVGATAVFAATGSSVGTYSWTGPNSFTSTVQSPMISNVQLINAGAYSVTFTKSNGCIATGAATVNVNPIVSITTQPTAISECIGGTQSFSVVATGGYTPLTYQWQSSTTLGGIYTDISGATSATYLLPSTAASALFYRVIVSSTGGVGCNPATSNPVQGTVVADPSVSVTIPPAIVCIGANITLTASPTVSTGTCTTQWQSSPDGTTWTNIIGGTGNSLNATLGTTTRYRAQLVSCSGSGCCN
jgi:hypothetical protein